MLLLHQAGILKVGEVVRYTLTYTPAHDRILPTPPALRVKVRNTSAVALRAAYLHGPYTLYAAVYPAAFDPWGKAAENAGLPQFEPNLKAGGSWAARLDVPEDIRETSPAGHRRSVSGGGASAGRPADARDGLQPSVTWIVEVSSQVLFSPSATVHYEVVVGRDEKALDFGFAGLVGGLDSKPGQLADFQDGRPNSVKGELPKGVFSTAIRVKVEDTASLWDKPALPTSDADEHTIRTETRTRDLQDKAANHPSSVEPDDLRRDEQAAKPRKRRKKVHLVVLTHGLHGNLGSDMLYMKESIDAAAKQARLDRKMKAAQAGMKHGFESVAGEQQKECDASSKPAQEAKPRNEGEDEDEEIVVRGYSGNVAKTERGIQYLGKRLAKYILSFTYPDQPCFPTKKSMGESISKALGSPDPRTPLKTLTHANSSVVKDEEPKPRSPYRITSISFIGHSLGGLVQTYAVAYIHKHSPEFFDRIKPINFVALASPFLGLSNENPMYVKFALDFGLVGRTGQDLGLTWRAPTIARSGWGAMIAGLGTEDQRKQRQSNPGTKPILRILPSGPAHHVLKLFRNRTVYSNVVNDGVVPLRTSCLLFLDWRGLGRVEKARRENGLVGTVAGWGWAEITGTNSTEQQRPATKGFFDSDFFGSTDSSGEDGAHTPVPQGEGTTVPQPSENATREDDGVAEPDSPRAHQFLSPQDRRFEDEEYDSDKSRAAASGQRPSSPLAGLINFFKPLGNGKAHHHEPKQTRIYRRGQTVKVRSADANTNGGNGSERTDAKSPESDTIKPGMARGNSVHDDSMYAPPKTTIFESAGDILNPPIPSMQYLTNPITRPRTIFHDRVYHPDDIPPPPMKRMRTGLMRTRSSDAQDGNGVNSRAPTLSGHDSLVAGIGGAAPSTGGRSSDPDDGGMKVEEKIARAYHRDLSWRKVLVRLEPDAHNNMVVRRMFANAYGWPVVKHLVDTHFADSYTARTADAREANTERAWPMDKSADAAGGEVAERPQARSASLDGAGRRTSGEERDGVGDLVSPTNVGNGAKGKDRPRLSRIDSVTWDDRFFETDDEDDENDEFAPPRSPVSPTQQHKPSKEEHKTSSGSSLNSRHGRNPPRVDIVKPKVAPTLMQSPGGAGSMGLRKSLEEQLDLAKKEDVYGTGSCTQSKKTAKPSKPGAT